MCSTSPDYKHASGRPVDLGCNPLLEPEFSFPTSTSYIHKDAMMSIISEMGKAHGFGASCCGCHSSTGRVGSLMEGLQDEANFPEKPSHTCTVTHAR